MFRFRWCDHQHIGPSITEAIAEGMTNVMCCSGTFPAQARTTGRFHSMQHVSFLRALGGVLPAYVRTLAVLLVCSPQASTWAQTFTNAGFESGTTGWSGCRVEINPANVYGGTGSSMVAEVDGDNDPGSTADDMLLCQSISGFTIGSVYTLDFDAARRQGGPTPSTVSANVQLDNALDVVVSRTGAWNMTREHLVFTATATTHNLRITPNFTTSYGMLFDNFSITLVSMLPVELLHFRAQGEGSSVQLNWATASERDNAGFVVERSTNGIDFGTVLEISGAGNSTQLSLYEAVDHAPLHGISYYRLRQTDLDGTTTISDVLAVDRHAMVIHAFPNPVEDLVTIQTAMEAAEASLYDAWGRLVLAQRATGATITMDMSALPSGAYVMRIRDDAEYTVVPVVKR